MGVINVLDKYISEKIAAGEVVERPASVIKELVENSIDAGATAVTVEIKHGGTDYMRVTDNGCGMSPEDARMSFLRHATSKIKTDTDLEHIHTLGFRGEALCSVAAVSKTELFTKERAALEGTHIVMEGGTLAKEESAGCPDGTTIVVRNLFYNTPARMKFMKKDATEAAYILDILNKQALGRCDVSVRFIRDGKEILYTPGDNVLKNAVHSVHGRDIAKEMLFVDYKKGGVSVKGLTGSRTLSRPNRLMQTFFVNNRFVISKTLSAALAEAYKNELMIGRFPACVLNVELDFSLVDVNVHPGKTEVKFADDRAVYEAVYWAVKSALADTAAPREVSLEKGKSTAAFKAMIQTMQQKQETVFGVRQQNAPPQKFKPYIPKNENPAPVKIAPPTEKSEVREALSGFEDVLPIKDVESLENVNPQTLPGALEPAAEESKPFAEKSAPKEPESQSAQECEYKIIGQLFETYILAESGDDFILLDQHAAHERLQYEKLIKNGGRAQIQALLVPITVNLTPSEKALLEERYEFFLSLGFEAEDFGEGSVILRTLPADCDFSDGADLLIELLSILGGNEKGDFSNLRDRAVYTVACKSAIRANRTLSVKEQESLFAQAMNLEGISTCPHGRPISIKLTKNKIEKMFGRIV